MIKLDLKVLSVIVLTFNLFFAGGNELRAAPYLKIPDPPDVDKPDRDGDGKWPDAGDNSCWLAAAANILGAAGYGDPEGIYDTFTSPINFGYQNGGFIGSALKLYLSEGPMPDNPYRVVTEYYYYDFWGGQSPRSFIASELRRCQFVGIQIYPESTMQKLGHALTVWGDGEGAEPEWVWVTDSDRDQGALDIDSYNWTLHADPSGSGHDLYSLDYWGTTNTGYLGYVVTLCPVPEATTLMLFGSGLSGLMFLARRKGLVKL